jgi:hypothetical protein
VDGAVVHHYPLLLRLLLHALQLIDLLEELADEVEVLELAVVSLDESPVRQSVVANDRY